MLNKLFRRRPLIEELEPRILYSADLAPFVLDSYSPAPEQRVILADGEFSSVAATVRNELVIVDSGVQDYETLLADILNQASNDRHFSVVVLDANRDGIEQISDVLKQYGNLDAVHLISHGGTGSLQLGNSLLDAASLDSRAAEIAAWGAAFNADADWLIYGCDVAAGVEGQTFVQRLSLLTRTDVAASENLTGNAASGGDWDLEFTAGHIETRLVLSAATQSQWQGLLEALANTTTANKDTNASVAVNPTTGAFVVTWTADGNQDGDREGIYAQVYDAAGNPVSGQILVNDITIDKQRNSAVAMDASGNFVVVWESPTSDYGIFAQRFDATGAKIGGAFIVNQTILGDQTAPAIAMAADGQFVVAWQDDRNNGDIYVRHFNSAGTPTSNEILAHTNTGSGQFSPAVAIKDSGSYVVVWQSDTGGSGKAIFAQRFNAADIKLGSEFRVNTYDTNDQTEPTIAMAPDGSFVVAWSSNNQDGSNRGVYAQRYDPSGVVAGAEFRVNTYTSGHQDRATVAMDGSGNFVIAWTSDGQDNGGSYGVYAQRYFANGSPNGGEFRVNTTTSGDQQSPSAAMSSIGNLVVAWDGNGPGDDKGIFWESYSVSNTPPVANPDVASTDEDTPVSSALPGVLGNDTDPDVGAILSVANILAGTAGTPTTVTAGGVTITAGYGSLLIRQDGSYTYTPNASTAQALAAGQAVSDVFTYIIKDDKNATAASTLTVTVNGLNDAPVANPDSYAVLKTNVLTISPSGVLGNDTDVDTNPVPDALSVTQVNGNALNVGNALTGTYGTLTLNADGSLTYAPDTGNATVIALGPGNSVVDSFTYQVSDGKGGSSFTSLAITVSGSNTAPVAMDDAYAMDENGVLSVPATGVLNNDTDPELNTLTATLISGVSNGTLVFNSNGSFTYTPNADFNGSDSFTYQVSDGSLTSNIATVTLSVNSVNDDPVAYGDTGTVNQDATLVAGAAAGVLGNDTDIDTGDTHTVTLIEAGSSSATVSPGTPGVLPSSFGTLTLDSDGSYSYVANGDASKALAAGETSDDVFTYTMRDAAGATSSATLTITITGVNDAPTISGVTATTAINDTGTATPFSGVVIGDVDSPAQTQTVSITLDLAAKGSLSNLGGGSYDAGTGVYSFSGTAAAATTAVQGLVFTPTANRVAPGSTETTTFTISVDDGVAPAVTDSTTTVITTSVNDAPTITGVTASTAINDTGTATPFSGVVIGDVDSPAQTQTVSITLDLAAKGSLSNLGGGTYNAGTGIYSFSGTAAAATTAVQGLVFTPTANRVAPGSTETTTFTISVDDGVAPAVTDSTTTVVTTSINDAPLAVADTASALEAGGVANGTSGTDPSGNVLSNDTDVDSGDTKTVTAVSFGVTPGVVGLGLAGAYGTLTLNADGSYSYVVNNSNATVQALRTSSDTLTDVFDYTMQDTAGAPSSSTLTITITGSNDDPVAVADTATAVEAGGVANGTAGTDPTGNVLTNDTDVDSGDTKTVTAVSLGVTPGVVGSGLAGAYGTLTLNADGSYSYAVNNSNAAVQVLRTSSDTLTEVFDYSMQDATGIPSSSTLTITITGSNDAPVTVADTATAVEAGGVANGTAGTDPTGNVLTNDTDVDSGDTRTVTAVSLGVTPGVVGSGLAGAYGTLTLNADGSYSYVVDNSNAAVQALRSSDSLTETFDYSLQDMAGALGSSTLTITITGSNDAPVITSSGTHVVVEESPATVSVTASDVENDALAFSITGGADAAWFTIDTSSGLLSLTFVPDYETPKDANLDNLYEVVVTVSDGNGGTNTLAVQLMVTDKVELVAALPDPPAPPLPPAPEATPDKEADTEETQPIATPVAPNEGIPKAATTTVASDASVTVVYQSGTATAPAQLVFNDAQANRTNATSSPTLVTLNQMLGGLGSDARALQMLQNSLGNGNFLQQLDQLQDAIRQQLNLDKNVVASTLAVSTGLSVGYVLWLVRGGVLLSSLLTSLPAWRLIDPLPILGHLAGKTANDDEDDSLEGMLKKSNEKIEPAPSDANEVTP